MRLITTLPALLGGLLLAAPSSVSALQVDIMWWDGPDQFGPDQTVFIQPFAGGDKLDGPGSTAGDGIKTWDLQVTNYSRTWDVTGLSAGALKQADLFVSFSSSGVSSYTLSTRYDGAGSNMLNVVAVREYNVRVGSDGIDTVDFGLGPTNACEPKNNCTHDRIVAGGTFNGSRSYSIAQESSGGSFGWIYGFSSTAEVAGEGPRTKGAQRVGTVRVGSILFELNAVTGSGVVIAGEFATQDGSTDNSGGNDPVTLGGGVLVIPEPSTAALLAAGLAGLAIWRRRAALRD